MYIESSAHAHTVSHYIRMLQSKIHRMVSSETASRHRQPRGLILPADKRHELVQDVAFELQMPHHPNLWVHSSVVPALGIDRVRAKHLQLAAFDFRGEHANHPAILILEKLTHGRRKHQ